MRIPWNRFLGFINIYKFGLRYDTKEMRQRMGGRPEAEFVVPDWVI
jgi:hypothetical protein